MIKKIAMVLGFIPFLVSVIFDSNKLYPPINWNPVFVVYCNTIGGSKIWFSKVYRKKYVVIEKKWMLYQNNWVYATLFEMLAND